MADINQFPIATVTVDLEAILQSGADAEAAKAAAEQARDEAQESATSVDEALDTRVSIVEYDATIHETAAPGTFLDGGPDGTLASNTAEGFRAAFARETIGADAFSNAGKTSIRQALLAGAPVFNYHEEQSGPDYKIVAINSEGTETDILGQSGVNWRHPMVLGDILSVASDRSDGAEAAVLRAYTASLPDAGTILRAASSVNPDRTAFIFVGMGESTMRGGQEPSAPVSGPYNLGTQMMSNGNLYLGCADNTSAVAQTADFAQLVDAMEPAYGSPNVQRQEVMIPLARRVWIEHGIPSSIINVGISGQQIAAISKGTVPYSNMLAALPVHISHWKRHGFRPVVIGLLNTGVNNSGGGSSYTSIQPPVLALRYDFEADARDALNDPSAVVKMFYTTPMSVGGTSNGSWVAGGLADLQYDHPDLHFAGGFMDIANVDRHHPSAAGYISMAECLYYRPIKVVIIDGLAWRALRPIQGASFRTGTTMITVPLEGNVGPVSIQTNTLVPSVSNAGVEVFGPAALSRTVSNVAIIPYGDGFAIEITGVGFSANDIVVGARQTFGSTSSPSDRARTNIADSDDLVGIYNTSPFPKWLPQFREVVA